MIIIEGIDRVGKTTLCTKISKELGIPIFRGNYVDLSNMKNKVINDERINTLVDIAEQVQMQEFVCDRFHWSEFVYGYANRGYINDYMFEIENRLIALKTKIILVKPTDVKRSSEEHGSELEIHNILFNELFNYSEIEKFSCDYKTLDKAIEWLRRNSNG